MFVPLKPTLFRSCVDRNSPTVLFLATAISQVKVIIRKKLYYGSNSLLVSEDGAMRLVSNKRSLAHMIAAV